VRFDRLALEDVFVWNELPWTLVCLVAGAGVDTDGQSQALEVILIISAGLRSRESCAPSNAVV